MRLADLKAQAQEHYSTPLDWTDLPGFGGAAWADVDHHTISVMVDPPAGNPHIAIIRTGRQMALENEPEAHGPKAPSRTCGAYQLGLPGIGRI